MLRSLWTAATGMIAQQVNLDVITNNLANVNTVGFKKNRADFDDLFYQIHKEPGAPLGGGTVVPTGIQIGLGARVAATQKIFTQGNYQQTENPLDVAIEGAGFFQVLLPDGTVAYTRDGAWKIDGEGQIVTSDGYLIEPAIVVPQEATSITITPEGRVLVTLQGQVEQEEIGQIQLARFVNPAGLKAIGKNLFVETVASGAPIVANPGEEGLGQIQQGFLEMSNVQVVEEMVNMIVAQRAYEANSKSVQTADEILRIVNNLRR